MESPVCKDVPARDSAVSVEDDTIVEEDVVYEEEQYFHVQFTAFDDFGDVKLLPTTEDAIPVTFTQDVSCSRFQENDTGKGSAGSFKTPMLTVVKGSLETDTPIMQFGSAVFRGRWCTENVCTRSSSSRTNLVVAELKATLAENTVPSESKRPRGAVPVGKKSPPADTPGDQVPSLLQHLPHGTDTDTAAKRRRMEVAENDARWSVASVIAPSALLIMERIA